MLELVGERTAPRVMLQRKHGAPAAGECAKRVRERS